MDEQVEIAHRPGSDRLGKAGAHRRSLDQNEIDAPAFERIEDRQELSPAEHAG